MTIKFKAMERFKSLPEAVIFDTDNTLYPYDPAEQAASEAVRNKAAKLLGVATADFAAAYNKARQQIKIQLGETASSHSRLLYIQRTIELLGMRTQLLMTLDLEQTYWRVFLSHCQLFSGVKDLLQDLRGLGIRTAVLTDLTARIQFRKLIYFGLHDQFDYVVSSEEAGHDKPHAAPFKLALAKLGIEPKKIWMIGDNAATDIAGAKKFGLISLQKNHGGVTLAAGNQAADVVFEQFEELQVLIENIRHT